LVFFNNTLWFIFCYLAGNIDRVLLGNVGGRRDLHASARTLAVGWSMMIILLPEHQISNEIIK
jgi:hypothetical protein